MFTLQKSVYKIVNKKVKNCLPSSKYVNNCFHSNFVKNWKPYCLTCDLLIIFDKQLSPIYFLTVLRKGITILLSLYCPQPYIFFNEHFFAYFLCLESGSGSSSRMREPGTTETGSVSRNFL